MDYTQASAHVTHPGTGQRMAQDTLPVPTASTAQDFNMVIWSLMEVIKAAGLSAAQFNPDVPATYQKLLTALRKMGVPPGTVAPMARLTVPDGWLVANGQSILKASFPDLYSAIGDAFKLPGDSATEFRVPELRGEFIRGMDAGRGVDINRVLGSPQAEQVGPHTHQLQVQGSNRDNGDPGPLVLTGPDIGGDNNGLNQLHTSSRALASSGTETRPRNVALLYMIKT
jgi:microcystin-dependent protein